MSENRELGQRQEDGLFAPEGMLRKVLGESVGLLGGGCDLLLQIAHPLVAEAVVDYSHFQDDPLARVRGTIDSMLGIVFGELGHARSSLKDFHAVHAPVVGVLKEQAGRFPAGTEYSGHDPELKFWVHASLIHTQLRVYELFVAPLTAAEREQYYQESKLLAWRMGIARKYMPDTLGDFNRYVAGMVHSDALAITPSTLELSRQVLRPKNVPFVARTGIRFTGFITTGLLPPRLRRDYQLAWGQRQQRVFNSMARASRLAVPLLPAPLRLLPRARKNRVFRWALQEDGRKAS